MFLSFLSQEVELGDKEATAEGFGVAQILDSELNTPRHWADLPGSPLISQRPQKSSEEIIQPCPYASSLLTADLVVVAILWAVLA